jgi:serralysin
MADSNGFPKEGRDLLSWILSPSNDAILGASAGVGTGASPADWLALIAPFNPPIIGTNGNDTLSAQAEGDVVLGVAGDDELSSAFNRTALLGGKDGDTLTTNVIIPAGPASADGLAVQIGGKGEDTLSATVTIQGAIPPAGNFGDQRTATILLDGGDDNDVIRAEARIELATLANVALTTLVYGGRGDDRIEAIADAAGALNNNLVANVVHGGDGADHITALAQTSFAGFNGVASNELTGGDGNDFLEATARAISINNELVSNILQGGRGDDVLHAFNFTSANVGAPTSLMELAGNEGDDVLMAVGQTAIAQVFANDSSHLDGGSGNDVLSVDSSTAGLVVQSHNLLEGGSGHDSLTANLSAVALGGFKPTPESLLFEASNTLDGGIGNDSLNASLSIENAAFEADASHAENRLTGGNGDDHLTAFAELTGVAPIDGDRPAIANYLDGGDGRDVLVATIAAGTEGASFLAGGGGNDQLTVFGGSGNVLDGGQGRDTLISGVGNDQMDGGTGADTLIFAPDNGADTAAFTQGEDTIDLTAFAASNIHAFADLDIDIADGNSIIRFDADNNVTVLNNTNLTASDFLFA